MWAVEVVERLEEVVGGTGVLEGTKELLTVVERLVEVEGVGVGMEEEGAEVLTEVDSTLAVMGMVRVVKFVGKLQDASSATITETKKNMQRE